MSAIKQELEKSVKFTPTRGESPRDAIVRLVVAIQDLDDTAWDALSGPAKEWVNSAAASINALDTNPNGEITPFPDAVAAAPARTPRVSAPAPAPAPVAPPAPQEDEGDGELRVGDVIKATTKRKKVIEGVIAETIMDDAGTEMIGVVLAEGDQEVYFDSLEGIEVVGNADDSADGQEPDAPEAELELAVGATAKLVTARGKEVVGVVTELQDDIVALRLIDGSTEDFPLSRLKSVTVVLGAEPAASAPARPRVSRGTTVPAPTPAETDAPATRTRASSNGGVAIGRRIQQIMAANTAVTLEAVKKQMATEKYEAKEATIDLQFRANTVFLDELRAAGKLK